MLTSVQNSLTFSRIMLQCLSKAFTRPRSLRLFLQLISTCPWGGEGGMSRLLTPRGSVLGEHH